MGGSWWISLRLIFFDYVGMATKATHIRLDVMLNLEDILLPLGLASSFVCKSEIKVSVEQRKSSQSRFYSEDFSSIICKNDSNHSSWHSRNKT